MVDDDVEFLVLRLDLRLYDSHQIIEQHLQRNHIVIERHLSAFDFGHIEHIVDQAEQMIARQLDLLETMTDPVLVRAVRQADMRHPDDRVHRRADIVRHIGQKLAFCPARLLRLFFQALRFDDLRFGIRIVSPENKKHSQQKDDISPDHEKKRQPRHAVHIGTDRTERQRSNQIPLRIGKRRRINIRFSVLRVPDRAERLVLCHFAHQLVHLIPVFVGRHLIKVRFRIIDPVVPGIADHVRAVLADDHRIDKRMLVAAEQRLRQFFCRKTDHDRCHFFSTVQNIVERIREQDDPVA